MTRIENYHDSVDLSECAKVAGLAESKDTICRCGFTLAELATLHYFCLKYSALVVSGRTPTSEQDDRFMRYSAVCYLTGAAYVK